MKLALVSTPRSGNTWLRSLLASIYRLEQRAVHHLAHLDWSALPPRCVVQIHWHRSPEFLRLLAENGVQVVTIARHPLDVLLSILQFAPHEPQTAMWLAGTGGDESPIHGRAADGSEFLSYCLGPRARALLSITPQWWLAADVVKLRYEELVAEPTAALAALEQRLGSPLGDVGEALDAFTIDKLRLTSSNQHFWKGQPGLWQQYIPAEHAGRIMQAHRDVFDSLGYSPSVQEQRG